MVYGSPFSVIWMRNGYWAPDSSPAAIISSKVAGVSSTSSAFRKIAMFSIA